MSARVRGTLPPAEVDRVVAALSDLDLMVTPDEHYASVLRDLVLTVDVVDEVSPPQDATTACLTTTVPCGFASCEIHYGRAR